MTTTDLTLSQEAEEFGWLLTNFAQETTGVDEAVAVSSDGLLLASSSGPDRESIDQIAAVVSGLASMSRGAADSFGLAGLVQVVIEAEGGYLFVARISHGSSLGVVTARNADIGLVGYHMTVLVSRVGECLTPDLITELTNPLA